MRGLRDAVKVMGDQGRLAGVDCGDWAGALETARGKGWTGEVSCKGVLPAGTRVAVVGSRRPTAEQARLAYAFGRTLAQAGVAVVSGGALGVDAAALLGALDAQGHAIAVLPRCPTLPYPPTHRQLYARIIEQGGATVGLRETWDPPPLWSFLRRNRLIAGLADGLVAICADDCSGTFKAASTAARAGLPLAAVPWPDHTPASQGTKRLVAGGAAAIANEAELLNWLGLLRQAKLPPCPVPGLASRTAKRSDELLRQVDGSVGRRQSYCAAGVAAAAPQEPPGLDTDERALWRILAAGSGRSAGLETLVIAAQMGRQRAASALLRLVLKDEVRQQGDGSFSLARK